MNANDKQNGYSGCSTYTLEEKGLGWDCTTNTLARIDHDFRYLLGSYPCFTTDGRHLRSQMGCPTITGTKEAAD